MFSKHVWNKTCCKGALLIIQVRSQDTFPKREKNSWTSTLSFLCRALSENSTLFSWFIILLSWNLQENYCESNGRTWFVPGLYGFVFILTKKLAMITIVMTFVNISIYFTCTVLSSLSYCNFITVNWKQLDLKYRQLLCLCFDGEPHFHFRWFQQTNFAQICTTISQNPSNFPNIYLILCFLNMLLYYFCKLSRGSK